MHRLRLRLDQVRVGGMGRALCLFAFATLTLLRPGVGQTASAASSSISKEAAEWASWATEHGQRAEPMAGGRVLFITATDTQATKSQRKTIDAVARAFDAAVGPASDVPKKAAALFYFEKQEHIAVALDRITQRCPYNAAWAQSMQSSFLDFVIEDPLVGGLAPFLTASQEWSGDNELGHRLANLLLVQRFGHQPRWLTAGLSWCIEQEALGSIYCFPDRGEFVSIAGHGGWTSELVRLSKAHKKSTMTMGEIAALKRGSFNDDAAACAWGAARFLIDNESRALPLILRDLGVAWQEGGREQGADGSWTRSANFELSIEVQQQIIEQHAAPDLWQRMTTAFAEGIKLRPTRGTRSTRPDAKKH